MNKADITLCFAPMMSIWPNAEVFKSTEEQLDRTIEVWARCLSDIPLWLGQRTAMKCCKECHFFPTPAEFRDKATEIRADELSKMSTMCSIVNNALFMENSLDRYYVTLPKNSPIKLVIDMAGGPTELVHTSEIFGNSVDRRKFEIAYFKAVESVELKALSKAGRVALR